MVSQSKQVLVVDNNSTVADTLANILQIRGYDAVAVYSLGDAIASGESRCPDAIITEVFWQRMEANLRLVTKLAESFPACKLILISSNIQKASRFLTGYPFPLLQRPTYPADILPFLSAVDEIVHS